MPVANGSVAYGSIETQTLYTHYRTWMLDHGYQPLGSSSFGRTLHRIFPTVDKALAGPKEHRSRLYTGISRIDS